MKKIFSFICVCTILLSANATIITAPQAEALPLPVLQPKNGDLGYETLSVAQAMEIGRSLEKGASTTETYVITGYVAAIESEYDETYHNQNYWISDQRGGNVSEVFYIYRGNNANAVQVGNMVSIVTKIYRYADQVIENKGNDCPVIILDYATSAVPTILAGNCGAEGNNLTCQLNMSTWDLTIQGSGRMIDSVQFFPWQWQSLRNKILTIQLPEGLTSIGMSAFDYCQKVTSVTIPEGVTSIGKRAFHYCKALTTMNRFTTRACSASCRRTIAEVILFRTE